MTFPSSTCYPIKQLNLTTPPSIWTAKVTVCEFLKRVTGLRWRRSTTLFLNFISIFLFSTLVAVVIATLAECQPFTHYWQVVPDPGPSCRTGYVNLITMGTCDVITDLLLVAFPVPIILLAQMPLKRKLALVILFALSLILVAITSYRVPSVITHSGSQQYRSLLASLEILAATAVSNVLVIGSFVRDRGIKKLKYKRAHADASISESMDKSFRRNTIMQNQWGSDSDLASGLGIRLDPEAYALPPTLPLAVARTGSIDPSWSFRSRDDDDNSSDSGEFKAPHEYLRTSQSPRDRDLPSPRRVSFSDVGGLLKKPLHEKPGHARSQTLAPPEVAQRRGGSRAFLEDLGIFGLGVAPAALARRAAGSGSGSTETELDTGVELQDVGGLLSRPRS
jgi:hypothetical protein